MKGPAESSDTAEAARLREEVRREHDMYLRALADFENYRRRTERELAGASYRGRRDVLLPLLEIVDGFDRALESVRDAPAAIAEGIRMMERSLHQLLEAQGVSRIESLGAMFDPAVHEAIGSAPNSGLAPGSVIEELQRGYRLGDDLLRPAKVRVAE